MQLSQWCWWEKSRADGTDIQQHPSSEYYRHMCKWWSWYSGGGARISRMRSMSVWARRLIRWTLNFGRPRPHLVRQTRKERRHTSTRGKQNNFCENSQGLKWVSSLVPRPPPSAKNEPLRESLGRRLVSSHGFKINSQWDGECGGLENKTVFIWCRAHTFIKWLFSGITNYDVIGAKSK